MRAMVTGQRYVAYLSPEGSRASYIGHTALDVIEALQRQVAGLEVKHCRPSVQTLHPAPVAFEALKDVLRQSKMRGLNHPRY